MAISAQTGLKSGGVGKIGIKHQMRNDQSSRQIVRKHETKCWVVGWEGTKVQVEAYKVIILEAREGFE